jgi:hypothetical protein
LAREASSNGKTITYKEFLLALESFTEDVKLEPFKVCKEVLKSIAIEDKFNND